MRVAAILSIIFFLFALDKSNFNKTSSANLDENLSSQNAIGRLNFCSILTANCTIISAISPKDPSILLGKPIITPEGLYSSTTLLKLSKKKLLFSATNNGVAISCPKSETANPTLFVPKSIPKSLPFI